MKINIENKISKIDTLILGDKIYFKSIDNEILNSNNKIIVTNYAIESYLYSYNNKALLAISNEDKVLGIKSDKISLIAKECNRIFPLKNLSYLKSSVFNNTNYHAYIKGNISVWEKEKKGFLSIVTNDFYVSKPSYNSNIVQIRKMEDFSLSFECNILKDFKAAKTFFIIGDILVIPYVIIRPSYRARMVAVDLNTGKEIWNLETDSHEFLIDEKKENIYAIIGSAREKIIQLQSINIDSGKLENTILKSNSYRDIVPWNASISEDKLIYSDNVEGGKIGIIDLSTNEIIDECDLKLGEGVKLYNPHFFEDKIYVLDTMKDVHVLEMCK